MKPVVLVILIGINHCIFAQKWDTKTDLSEPHEIKLNLPMAIFGKTLEMAYEHVITPNFSIGSSLGAGFGDESIGYRFQIGPYVRLFEKGFFMPQNMPASGYFLEINASCAYKKASYHFPYLIPDMIITLTEENTVFSFGGGISAGWKFVGGNNWLLEIFSGTGYDFIRKKKYDSTKYYYRIGFSVGKRF